MQGLGKSIADPDVVKSLVFMAEGRPVLIVLLGADKVRTRLSCVSCMPSLRLYSSRPCTLNSEDLLGRMDPPQYSSVMFTPILLAARLGIKSCQNPLGHAYTHCCLLLPPATLTGRVP